MENEYRYPTVDILETADENEQLVVTIFGKNGIPREKIDIFRGYAVTRYEIKLQEDVSKSKVLNILDSFTDYIDKNIDENIRIEMPVPGKAVVAFELPNKIKKQVLIREVIESDEFNSQESLLSVAIGKDVACNNVICDIAKMPHLLIAGARGSDQSVCMNSIIVSILYRARPDEVKFLMIDAKKDGFSKYENIPHLLFPVVTDPRKASGTLRWAVSEMLDRYQAFSDTGVRDIEGYNKSVKEHPDMEPMPKIVICIAELADLMTVAPEELENNICRLAQMGRAVGMHLVIATQWPSFYAIPGLVLANIPSRIALAVYSQKESETILDTCGAEKLIGRGDMLYLPIGASKPKRVQGCFISNEEIEEVCNYINGHEKKYFDTW